jgi:hypothetical protein
MSGNTYVVVVYASPPLSGGGVEPPNAKLATFRNMQSPERGEGVGKTVTLTVLRGRWRRQRKMQSPVSLELLEVLARSHIPQPNAVVVIILSAAA